VRYQQICPVSLASEVIAERWTPLILREIVLFERHHFSEIQYGARLSVLARRDRFARYAVEQRRLEPARSAV
jgi:DNA-binding HxlR family transcriptional regulator